MATIASSSKSKLAPGFRFHPTDEELVRYYLRRKVCGRPFLVDAISDVDIYKLEPWDLPGKSRLPSRDLEWYFFSGLDKKYGNSSRTNRATEKGYWKTTGKDRAVYHRSQVVGMKKTLVYHCGRAPRGERTNWVMHEYRLVDEELAKAGVDQDAFVLCRVFQKSGSGPKNGEQYGAPFVEEEWEVDEFDMFPKVDYAEEVEVGDDAYLDGNDLDQILGTDVPPVEAPLPVEWHSRDNGIFVGENTDSNNDGSQNHLVSVGENQVEAPLPLEWHSGDNGIFVEDNTDSNNDGSQNHLVSVGKNYCLPEEPGSHPIHDLPIYYDMDARQVKHEYMPNPSKSFEEVDYLLDEPFMDSLENIQFGEGAFLETNDLANPVAADAVPFDDFLDQFLTFHDADGTFDPPNMVEGEDFAFGAIPDEKDIKEVSRQAMITNEQFTGPNQYTASSSQQQPVKSVSDCQHPFLERASRMLGSIPAPPAFASEFPKKDALLNLNPSSSSVHVTAGIVQIRNFPLVAGGTDWSLGKHGGYNFFLSFGLLHDEDDTADPAATILPRKPITASSRGWFYYLFIWVLVLSMSFKIGTLICAR